MSPEQRKLQTVIQKLKALEQSTRNNANEYRQARLILERVYSGEE